jgi:hypothetical protein
MKAPHVTQARSTSALLYLSGVTVSFDGFRALNNLSLLIEPGSSYWAGAFPTILVMALGMTIAVAPLTSSVLGSVEEQHVAMASGFNSAVARTGGLIATALLGAVLASEGKKLFAGFHSAMIVSGVVAALGSVVALTMLPGVRMKNAA